METYNSKYILNYNLSDIDILMRNYFLLKEL